MVLAVGLASVSQSMPELLFKDKVYEIAGAMMEVYKTLGTGFLEPVYQEALAAEFSLRSVPFEREKPLELFYKNIRLDRKYVPDFVCFGQIILELKVLPIDKLFEDHKDEIGPFGKFWQRTQVGVETICFVNSRC